MTEFKRIIEWTKAFDKRDKDPKKNYGIHGMEIRFVLRGPLGAVQFLLFTNWMMPHIAKKYEHSKECTKYDFCTNRPMPADLGYHSLKPTYEGQLPVGAAKLTWVDNPDYGKKDVSFLSGLKEIPKTEPTGTFTPCPYLDGAPCYYDGSGLDAEKAFNTLVAHGDEALWRLLERRYKAYFEAPVDVSAQVE